MGERETHPQARGNSLLSWGAPSLSSFSSSPSVPSRRVFPHPLARPGTEALPRGICPARFFPLVNLTDLFPIISPRSVVTSRLSSRRFRPILLFVNTRVGLFIFTITEVICARTSGLSACDPVFVRDSPRKLPTFLRKTRDKFDFIPLDASTSPCIPCRVGFTPGNLPLIQCCRYTYIVLTIFAFPGRIATGIRTRHVPAI